MEKTLKQSIFGQDHAISIVCDKMKIAKLGLQSTSRPIGCFLFYGPTGVGKTELAKQLANSLQIKLLRFDMSEYSESHSVSRIVGSPPGYVGFEQGGLLTDAVYHNQHCVLLLDEMEKAHHNIYNMLLQIMDRGIITDSSGREVNFTHSVIIMTTNLGSESFERNAIGFNRQDNDASIKDIEKFFSPEFRNRLSAIIKFNGLTPLSVELIVEKSIGELQERLKARSVELVVDRSVVRHVVEKNKSMKNGARFIDAFVSNHIAKPIADVIIEQASCKNMVINIAAVGDSISINIEKRVSQRQKAKQVQKIRAESE